MIDHPYETSSDSFCFVGDKLIMHNKGTRKRRGMPPRSSPTRRSTVVRPRARHGRQERGAAAAKAEAKTSGGAGGGAKAEGKSDAWSKGAAAPRGACSLVLTAVGVENPKVFLRGLSCGLGSFTFSSSAILM